MLTWWESNCSMSEPCECGDSVDCWRFNAMAVPRVASPGQPATCQSMPPSHWPAWGRLRTRSPPTLRCGGQVAGESEAEGEEEVGGEDVGPDCDHHDRGTPTDWGLAVYTVLARTSITTITPSTTDNRHHTVTLSQHDTANTNVG